MTQETPINSLGNNPQLNQDDSRLVDSILNDLNNSKGKSVEPQQLSPEEHQAMLAQRQDELMQNQMQQQMMQQEMMNQEKANVISDDIGSNLVRSFQDNLKYIIIVVILSVLINIGPVDDIFKVGEKYFLEENGNLNIQAIIIKDELYNRYRTKEDFIQKYIFPGGFLPSQEYIKKLAEKRELTAERKENLQKLLNLSDNISVQEEELIKFLNTYS